MVRSSVSCSASGILLLQLMLMLTAYNTRDQPETVAIPVYRTVLAPAPAPAGPTITPVVVVGGGQQQPPPQQQPGVITITQTPGYNQPLTVVQTEEPIWSGASKLGGFESPFVSCLAISLMLAIWTAGEMGW